ncbi:MAG TPA: tripartite tricarboxylate transporter substrate-binding protein [Xanthobacteraceae bacterium]|nr:tripartite tricarboxylate transporter substrate-binding protein [Xanthobacteraceae bacterium]
MAGRNRFAAALVVCVSVGFTAGAGAQPAAEFFKGKPMRFTVVYEPGGTYDLYSRLVITHLPKHIPGNPTIAIQYMPGAGGMVGTLNLHDKIAQDGTQLGMLPRDIAINQMLHPQDARYDTRRFSWIGRVASYTGVVFVTSRTGVRNAEDLRRLEVVAGTWGPTTDSFITPTLLNALAGTRFKIVTGYRGAADVDLAIERNEADARVSSWTAVKTTRGAWLNEGRIVVPFQTGLKRHPEMPDLPLASELALNEEGRRILEFMSSDSSIGWNVIAPPGVPVDRVVVLRRAFDAMMADPEFLADAQKRGFEIIPARGEEMQEVVNRTIATPPESVARLRAILGGAK